jgi:DNA-binding beta-propeller fold protein YncE
MQTGVDTLLKVIPVGKYPLEMAASKSKELLFVTCQEDTNPNPLAKGSIYVIDMKTLTVVKIIKEKFYQPHGIAIDDKRDLLYVISRNADRNGPAPHHISECGNRNGFFHVININTWQRVSPTSEVSVDPYSADVR